MTAQPEPDTDTSSAGDAQTIASVFWNGIAQLAELQKFGLDVIARQNAAAAGVVKQAMRAAGSEAGAAIAGRVEEALGEFIGHQKEIVNLATERSGEALNAAGTFVKTAAERVGTSGVAPIAAVTDGARQTVDACADIQRRCIDLVEQQTATAFVNIARLMKGSAA